MRPAGKRQKGSRAERYVAKEWRKVDKDAKRMLLSGGGYLKGDVYTRLPWTIEVKDQEKCRPWEWWAQTEAQCSFGKRPLLVMTGNHRPYLAVLKLDDLIDLIKTIQDYEQGG